MGSVLMVRYAEIHLKGQNRGYFLKKLLVNVRRAAREAGRPEPDVTLRDGRVYLRGVDDPDACARRVARVFGVHAVSPCVEVQKDWDAIRAAAEGMAQGRTGTFKVQARRSDKHFPMTSDDINRALGGALLDANPALRVDVVKPDWTLDVEIREQAYLRIDSLPGPGGMPAGTGGKACLLLSGGIDSPVAGYLTAKRGVSLTAVYFHAFPYTSDRAREKVEALARILSEPCGEIALYVVPFTPVQERLREAGDERYGTVLMRRMMMRIAELLARREGALALVTGESIGQVASQTLEALAVTNAVVTMPVFRPCIGMDKLEIIRVAEAIGTYETSCLPYEDCCSVFTPQHPATHPTHARAERDESGLDVAALAQAAADAAERVVIGAL